MSSNTTLLFASTNLATITGITVTDWSGLWTGLYRRGDHDVIPGRDGHLGNQLPLDAYNFTISVMLDGASESAMFTALTGLATALTGAGGLGTLQRRIDNGSGSYNASYAKGAFAGISPTLLNLQTGQIDLTFGNLSGRWFSDTGYTVPVAI